MLGKWDLDQPPPPPPSGPYLLDASVQRKQSENPSQEKRPLGGSDSGAGEAAT